MSSLPEHSGWLRKRRPRGKNDQGQLNLFEAWQRRHFALAMGEIAYSKAEGGEALGAIKVEVDTAASPTGAEPGEFTLTVRERCYTLRADDAEGAQEWCDAIELTKMKLGQSSRMQSIVRRQARPRSQSFRTYTRNVVDAAVPWSANVAGGSRDGDDAGGNRALGDDDVPSLEGWMRKQDPEGIRNPTWQRRWLRLKNGRLLVYASDREKRAALYVDLQGCQAIVDSFEHGGRGIRIVDAAYRSVQFLADSQDEQQAREEAAAWLRALQLTNRMLLAGSISVGKRNDFSKRESATECVRKFEQFELAERMTHVRQVFEDTFRLCKERHVPDFIEAANAMLQKLLRILEEADFSLPPTPAVGAFYRAAYHEEMHGRMCPLLEHVALDPAHADAMRMLAWIRVYEAGVSPPPPRLSSHAACRQIAARIVPYFEGYIGKQQSSGLKGARKWQRRFMVLEDLYLKYWEDDPRWVTGADGSEVREAPNFSAQVTDVEKIVASHTDEGKATKGKVAEGIAFVLHVKGSIIRGTKKKELKFMCDDAEAVRVWVMQIQSVIAAAEKLGAAAYEERRPRLIVEFEGSTKEQLRKNIDLDFEKQFRKADGTIDSALVSADRLVDELVSKLHELDGVDDDKSKRKVDEISTFYTSEYNLRLSTRICTPQILGNELMSKRSLFAAASWVQSYQFRMNALHLISRIRVDDFIEYLNEQTLGSGRFEQLPAHSGTLRVYDGEAAGDADPSGKFETRFCVYHNCCLQWFVDEFDVTETDAAKAGVQRSQSAIAMSKARSGALDLLRTSDIVEVSEISVMDFWIDERKWQAQDEKADFAFSIRTSDDRTVKLAAVSQSERAAWMEILKETALIGDSELEVQVTLAAEQFDAPGGKKAIAGEIAEKFMRPIEAATTALEMAQKDYEAKEREKWQQARQQEDSALTAEPEPDDDATPEEIQAAVMEIIHKRVAADEAAAAKRQQLEAEDAEQRAALAARGEVDSSDDSDDDSNGGGSKLARSESISVADADSGVSLAVEFGMAQLDVLVGTLSELMLSRVVRKDVMDFFCQEYFDNSKQLVECVLGFYKILTQGQILRVLEFMVQYEVMVPAIYVSAAPEVVSLVSGAASVSDAMMRYVSVVEKTLVQWCEQLVENESQVYTNGMEAPETNADGNLVTSATTDLFRMVLGQISIVQGADLSQLTFETVQGCISAIEAFLTKTDAMIAGDIPLELLCATVNNCSSAIDSVFSLGADIDGVLEQAHKEKIDMGELGARFLTVAKLGTKCVINEIMSDLEGLLGSLFSSKWRSSSHDDSVMGNIVSTVDDYFGDLNTWLMPSFYAKVVYGVLEQLILEYMRRMIQRTLPPAADSGAAAGSGGAGRAASSSSAERAGWVDDTALGLMSADIGRLNEFFSAHMTSVRQEQQLHALQALHDVRELLYCSPSMAGINFEFLHSRNPDAGTEVVELLLQMRQDTASADGQESAKLIRMQCRAVIDGTRRTKREPRQPVEPRSTKAAKRTHIKAFFLQVGVTPEQQSRESSPQKSQPQQPSETPAQEDVVEEL